MSVPPPSTSKATSGETDVPVLKVSVAPLRSGLCAKPFSTTMVCVWPERLEMPAKISVLFCRSKVTVYEGAPAGNEMF